MQCNCNSTGSSSRDLLHSVESTSGLEPVDLLIIEGMIQKDGIGAAVAVAQETLELGSRSKGFETKEGDLIIGSNLVIVCLVVEGQGQHPLLLQVRLVDSGKRLDNDSSASEESWFQSCMFTRRSFSVVFVTKDDPI